MKSYGQIGNAPPIPHQLVELFNRDDRAEIARGRGTSRVTPVTASSRGGGTTKDHKIEALQSDDSHATVAVPSPTLATLRAATPTIRHPLSEPTATPRRSYQLPFTSGNWRVELSEDPMTDARSCTGFYKSRRDIQLNQGHLYFGLRGRGGVRASTVRFDDDPPRPMRLPGSVEKELAIVDIGGSEFSRVLEARRLRVQVMTVLNTVVNEDLDLTGLSAAYDVITSSACR